MPKPKGQQIRRRRQERGLTTAELAARVGFTNGGSLRNIENRDDPAAMIKLYRIARELGITVDEIMVDDAAPSAGAASDRQRVSDHVSNVPVSPGP